MTTFPGYPLPAELIALREQIRRIVRDELLPIEQRLAAKTKAAGLWSLGAPEQHGGDGVSKELPLERPHGHRPITPQVNAPFR